MNRLKLAVSLAATSFTFAISLTSASAACPDLAAKLRDNQVAHATDVTNYIYNCPFFTGNIGIGTTTPQSVLTIYTNSAPVTAANLSQYSPTLIDDGVANGWVTVSYNTLNSSGGQFVLARAQGTAASPSAIQSGNTIGSISFRGYNGSQFTGSKGYITGYATENWTTTTNGTALEFRTTPTGTSTMVRAMLIDSTQGVSIGQTYAGTLNQAPANGLLVQGNVGIGTTSPQVTLDIVGSGQATGGFSTTSDIRDKRDIAPLSFAALTAIEKLRPVTFFWKTPKDDGMQGMQTGLIAQEIEKVLPSTVLTAHDPRKSKSIKYNELTAVLIKAVQEQQQEIHSQAEEIRKLRQTNAKIEARLKRMEQIRLARKN